MLHILISSPYSISIPSLLMLSTTLDDLICIQDGVILSTIVKDDIFKKIYKNFNLIYFLKNDLFARGLLKIAKKNSLIITDYSVFVLLTAGHNKSITW
ncbi:sulfurtransferase complex subunit TusB [Buchnera aphidicola]|uniref:Uncharacterized conserved protein n=2 Tax=Buchnera aphidicola (Cinara cedri) TaxID=261318 RepID=Q056Z8_BUCCC|nr:sulfurtransferase complex subunit TusB [Buchnera aphidicola]AAW72713.1 hypothetical protein [Buchnera aphidicola (Cinara cedri)]ABJ90801.1 uncharacterized conserved protein [Buchnera aphidicola BCc]